MEQKIKSYMEEYHMTDPGDHLLVGVSGGADSVALLRLLAPLRETLGITLETVHVEHGIRGAESARDAAFVEELCQNMGVPFMRFDVDVPAYAASCGLGMEEAARSIRYEKFAYLSDLRRKEGRSVKVALAHHREDNAETILFHLARGSGVDGLCGILPVRKGAITCIRPLLGIGRKEIEEYLDGLGQAYCVDSTNLENTYTRNRIRHEIIPRLEAVNAQAVAHINQSAVRLSLICDYLKEQADNAYCRIAKEQDGAVALSLKGFLSLHEALQTEVLKRALRQVAGSGKDMGAVHLRQLQKLAKKQSGCRTKLPMGIWARREFDSLWIEKKVKLDTAGKETVQLSEETVQVSGEELRQWEGRCFQLKLGEKGAALQLEKKPFTGRQEEIVKKTYTKCLDYDTIKDGFCIRHRKPGDYFIFDAAGHHKRLKEYLIENRIPAAERDGLWLMARESEIIWLIGGRMSENYKVTAATKQMAVLGYCEQEKEEP